jgi:hypothetical protein
MGRTQIELEDKADRWRYVCPAGHRSWEPTNEHFFCVVCARRPETDTNPSFRQLRDQKTGNLLDRDDVELLTDAGPYSDVATEAGI